MNNAEPGDRVASICCAVMKSASAEYSVMAEKRRNHLWTQSLVLVLDEGGAL